MKINLFKTFGLWMLLAFSVCVGFMACNSSDDSISLINPSKVFPGKRLKSTNVMSFIYDSNGFLIKINRKGLQVDVEYIKDDEVNMTSVDDEDGTTRTLQFTIGQNGFASKCVETYKTASRTKIDDWTFKYDAEGHLIETIETDRSDQYIITCKMTYKDGNIISSSFKSSNGDYNSTSTLNYISEKAPTSIGNKGGVMLWDDVFDIEIGYMEYAFQAGFLGVPTSQLPISNKKVDKNSSTYSYSIEWTLDTDNYPINAEQTDLSNGSSDEFTFTW